MKRGKGLWEGFLLILSLNCESRRAVLPVPQVVQNREDLPRGAVQSITFPSLLSLLLGCSFPRLRSLPLSRPRGCMGSNGLGLYVGLYW